MLPRSILRRAEHGESEILPRRAERQTSRPVALPSTVPSRRVAAAEPSEEPSLYTPKAGKEALLQALVEKHLRGLSAEQLVSDKP